MRKPNLFAAKTSLKNIAPEGGIFVVGVDVTDRTLAEARLREQAGRLREFNESLETAVAVLTGNQQT